MTWHWAFVMIQLDTNPLQSTIEEHLSHIQLANSSSSAKLTSWVIWKALIGLMTIMKQGIECIYCFVQTPRVWHPSTPTYTYFKLTPLSPQGCTTTRVGS